MTNIKKQRHCKDKTNYDFSSLPRKRNYVVIFSHIFCVVDCCSYTIPSAIEGICEIIVIENVSDSEAMLAVPKFITGNCTLFLEIH